MNAKIVSVAPRMKNGEHDVWVNNEGVTYYKFVVTLDNGQSGEVKGMSETLRFVAGEEVTVKEFKPSANPKFPLGTLKLDKIREGQAPTGNGTPQAARPTASNVPPMVSVQHGGWTKEKEQSVMIQGLLKSIIEAGVPKEEWDVYLKSALTLHDGMLAGRTKSPNPVPLRQDAPPIAWYTQAAPPVEDPELAPF